MTFRLYFRPCQMPLALHAGPPRAYISLFGRDYRKQQRLVTALLS